MKINISELRDMVAEAVRRTVAEAKKKPKELPQRSEESIAAERERQLKALPGYAHGNVLDMSKPLGKKNRYKAQGASNMGNWTSESRLFEAGGSFSLSQEEIALITKALSCLIDLDDGGKVTAQCKQLQQKLQSAPQDAISVAQKVEGIRALVRMVVGEEIKVRRGH